MFVWNFLCFCLYSEYVEERVISFYSTYVWKLIFQWYRQNEQAVKYVFLIMVFLWSVHGQFRLRDPVVDWVEHLTFFKECGVLTRKAQVVSIAMLMLVHTS